MNLYLVQNFFLVILLLIISRNDSELYKIPDKYIGAVIGNWMFPLFLHLNFCRMLAGFAAGLIIGGLVLVVATIFDIKGKRKCLGGGDVKLIFSVSLYLGMERAFYMLFLSCIFGLFLCFAKGKTHRNSGIPFGPAIAFGTIFMIFFS